MTLVAMVGDRPIFVRASIMMRAHELGRFALAMCRTAKDRNQQRSRWLKRAWAEAMREFRERVTQRDRAAEHRLAFAANVSETIAMAARYDDDRLRIEQALTRETMRDRMNFTAVAQLEAALALVMSRSH